MHRLFRLQIKQRISIRDWHIQYTFVMKICNAEVEIAEAHADYKDIERKVNYSSNLLWLIVWALPASLVKRIDVIFCELHETCAHVIIIIGNQISYQILLEYVSKSKNQL